MVSFTLSQNGNLFLEAYAIIIDSLKTLCSFKSGKKKLQKHLRRHSLAAPLSGRVKQDI